MRSAAGVCLIVLLIAWGASASEKLPITIRGKTLTLELYAPPGGAPPKGTVLMGSGDVGWVGLGVDLSELLSKEGYFVVGVNVRQYLASFTSGAAHVTIDQVPADYGAIVQLLRDLHRLTPPVVVAGVSEGAALAVLAGAAPTNRAWLTGVITMGLPPNAELAWRWSDVASWITKRDADEPSFEPAQIVGRVSPVPLWMIQSTKDEYVTEADYRRFESLARPPRRLVLIDASNHRFTDRRAQLWQQFLAGLAWFRDPRPR
jgi:type IV secretory pathway VirJ component